jgi:hypothetical protein
LGLRLQPDQYWTGFPGVLWWGYADQIFPNMLYNIIPVIWIQLIRLLVSVTAALRVHVMFGSAGRLPLIQHFMALMQISTSDITRENQRNGE